MFANNFASDNFASSGTDFRGAQARTSTGLDRITLSYVDVLGLIAYGSSNYMQACLELNHWSERFARPVTELWSNPFLR